MGSGINHGRKANAPTSSAPVGSGINHGRKANAHTSSASVGGSNDHSGPANAYTPHKMPKPKLTELQNEEPLEMHPSAPPPRLGSVDSIYVNGQTTKEYGWKLPSITAKDNTSGLKRSNHALNVQDGILNSPLNVKDQDAALNVQEFLDVLGLLSSLCRNPRLTKPFFFSLPKVVLTFL